MRIAFADTYYFLALAVETDAAHPAAIRFASTYAGEIVTSDWILVELADALSRRRHRPLVGRLFEALRTNPRVTIVNGNRHHLDGAEALYLGRADKDWSLTDCTSFIIMREFGVADAITGDHHFAQAGFNVLLRPEEAS
jgi:predicted nucleic acid-binding protein